MRLRKWEREMLDALAQNIFWVPAFAGMTMGAQRGYPLHMPEHIMRPRNPGTM